MGADRLAEFELLVMLAALRLGPDDAYAVPIVDDIEARTGRPVRRSNVYTTLQRLEAKGLISTHHGDPRPERGGKARRLEAVEADGLAAVREATHGSRAMWGGLEDFIGEAT
jgi:DNA-binding PadR family transcriptional regulator